MGESPCFRAFCPDCEREVVVEDETCPDCGRVIEAD